jgi:hypothetical protein
MRVSDELRSALREVDRIAPAAPNVALKEPKEPRSSDRFLPADLAARINTRRERKAELITIVIMIALFVSVILGLVLTHQ